MITNCGYCEHELTPACAYVNYVLRGARIPLCRALNDTHPQDCYKQFRDMNKQGKMKNKHEHNWVYALRSSRIYCANECKEDYFIQRDKYLAKMGIAKGIGAISDYPVPKTLNTPPVQE